MTLYGAHRCNFRNIRRKRGKTKNINTLELYLFLHDILSVAIYYPIRSFCTAPLGPSCSDPLVQVAILRKWLDRLVRKGQSQKCLKTPNDFSHPSHRLPHHRKRMRRHLSIGIICRRPLLKYLRIRSSTDLPDRRRLRRQKPTLRRRPKKSHLLASWLTTAHWWWVA